MNKSFPNTQSILKDIDRAISRSKFREDVLLSVCKILSSNVSHYNWVGFYLVEPSGDQLVLGPYVGASTEHTKIAFGTGVCGQVATSETRMIIQNVALEDNYLSCGSNVLSEAVFPVMKEGKMIAELDIDSHALSPFTQDDTALLEAICLKLEVLF